MIEITPETSVSDLVQLHPQVIPIFLRHQMACVGCNMSRFETLSEAARAYAIPEEQLLQDIKKCIFQ